MSHTPRHGPWCKARTWPTTCQSCSASVFFFTCNCGSKVFFDELGPPWPRHDSCNRSWASNLRRTRDEKTGELRVELSSHVTVVRSPLEDDFSYEPRATLRKPSQDPIMRVDPKTTSKKVVVGYLREITKHVDPMTAYKLEDTAMARAMLGKIGKQKVGRVTVHEPNRNEERLDSFTAWIPSSLLSEPWIRRETIVEIVVEGVRLPNDQLVWFCGKIEIPI